MDQGTSRRRRRRRRLPEPTVTAEASPARRASWAESARDVKNPPAMRKCIFNLLRRSHAGGAAAGRAPGRAGVRIGRGEGRGGADEEPALSRSGRGPQRSWWGWVLFS